MIILGIDSSYKFANDERSELEFFELEGVRILSTAYLFKNCKNLTNLISNDVNTSFVKTAEGMFEGCTSIKNIDLSKYNFSSCNDFRFMFKDCTSLETVRFGRYSIKNTAYVDDMFKNCKNLINIEVPYECRRLYDNIIGQANWQVVYYNKNNEIVTE